MVKIFNLWDRDVFMFGYFIMMLRSIKFGRREDQNIENKYSNQIKTQTLNARG